MCIYIKPYFFVGRIAVLILITQCWINCITYAAPVQAAATTAESSGKINAYDASNLLQYTELFANGGYCCCPLMESDDNDIILDPSMKIDSKNAADNMNLVLCGISFSIHAYDRYCIINNTLHKEHSQIDQYKILSIKKNRVILADDNDHELILTLDQ